MRWLGLILILTSVIVTSCNLDITSCYYEPISNINFIKEICERRPDREECTIPSICDKSNEVITEDEAMRCLDKSSYLRNSDDKIRTDRIKILTEVKSLETDAYLKGNYAVIDSGEVYSKSCDV